MGGLTKESEEEKRGEERKGGKVEPRCYSLGHLEDGVPLLS